MHVLVTADTVGGVWTYTRELVSGLAKRGIRVTLVSFGGIPKRAQTAWMETLPDVEYFPTGFRLEWMQDAAERSSPIRPIICCSIIRECKPDLLHLSQYCYGSLDVALPKVVVAHSDVMSWSLAVRGVQPDDPWAQWYRAIGAAGAWPEPACWSRRRAGCWTALRAVMANSRTRASFTTDDRPLSSIHS